MALQRLRCPSNNFELKALVDATPGYYVGPDEPVYSDRFTSEKLKEIMDWTNKDFFMGGGMGKMLSRVMKVVRIGYVDADVIKCLMKSGFYKATGINSNNRLSENEQLNF